MSNTVERTLENIRGLLSRHTERGAEDQMLTVLEDAGAKARTTVGAKARVIDGLQRGHTGRRKERMIRDILLATHGAELTALKNRIDAGGDYRDLQQLVYSDIDNRGLRKEILEHIAREAEGLDEGPTGLKLLSDIDDTFYASLKDKRYPRDTTYPGVLPFYKEMDRRTDGGRRGDIAFVTARPRTRAGTVENVTQKMFRKRGLGDVTVLSGNFESLLSNEKMAEKKYENFVEYQRLFPEYKFVFCGDSGQGDAIFGAKIRADYPDAVRAIYIHDVIDTAAEGRAEWLAKGVTLCDTYVGTAADACENGLLTADALERVVEEAGRELDAVEFENADQEANMRKLFDRDIARARQVIGG